jgi:hypothetical protein
VFKIEELMEADVTEEMMALYMIYMDKMKELEFKKDSSLDYLVVGMKNFIEVYTQYKEVRLKLAKLKHKTNNMVDGFKGEKHEHNHECSC